MNDANQADVYADEERAEVREGWRIETLADADWALKRIGELEQEKAEVTAIEAERVAEIHVRAETLRERVDRGVRFFSAKLREFAETHRDELLKGGKAKSRALIHGSIGWRKKGGGPVVVDKVALERWAMTQPPETGFVRIKSEPAWDSIKQHISNTGEVVPGVELAEESEEFQVKPGGKSK
jgi:phage host-nuclease inhibitor protein Gam